MEKTNDNIPEHNANPVQEEATNDVPNEAPESQEESEYRVDPCISLEYPGNFDQETTQRKGSSGTLAKAVIGALSVLFLATVCCVCTAVYLNVHWQNKLELFTQAANQKIDVLQKQLEDPGYSSDYLQIGITAPNSENALTPAQVYASNVSATVAITASGGTGSGFVVTDDGYVVTNYHVVADARSVSVTTHDEVSHEAKLIGYDAFNDVAVLKIDGEDLPCVTFGSSTSLSVGDQVVAVGNPLGELTSTLTVGYVSAKDRVVDTDGSAMNMLQTDAAINSGNSGGPLFNVYGQVIGITTAKYSGLTSSGATIEGIGFAIPIDDVIGIIEDLYRFGYVTGAYLGVTVRDIESVVVENYGLPAGAFVVETVSGGSANRAGVQSRDIITNIGGYDVTSIAELTRVLRNFEAGETTTITIYRSGRTEVLSITLDEKPKNLLS